MIRKHIPVEYQLEGRRFKNEIRVSYFPTDKGVSIGWASHGELSIKDAKAFARALNKAIRLAEKEQAEL